MEREGQKKKRERERERLRESERDGRRERERLIGREGERGRIERERQIDREREGERMIARKRKIESEGESKKVELETGEDHRKSQKDLQKLKHNSANIRSLNFSIIRDIGNENLKIKSTSKQLKIMSVNIIQYSWKYPKKPAQLFESFCHSGSQNST